jgi:hypothetical protein
MFQIIILNNSHNNFPPIPPFLDSQIEIGHSPKLIFLCHALILILTRNRKVRFLFIKALENEKGIKCYCR